MKNQSFIEAMDAFVTVTCDKCGGTGKCTVFNFNVLRQRRQYVGVSLRRVAKALKLSSPYLSDVERGNRNATKAIQQAYTIQNLKKLL